MSIKSLVDAIEKYALLKNERKHDTPEMEARLEVRQHEYSYKSLPLTLEKLMQYRGAEKELIEALDEYIDKRVEFILAKKQRQ